MDTAVHKPTMINLQYTLGRPVVFVIFV